MKASPTHRERKAADTRLRLLQALLERIDERPLADIPVKELCHEAGVSPATFFNYFESKYDLVRFFLRLWSVQMAAIVVGHDADDPLGAIEAIFHTTDAQSEPHPGLLAEIIAHQARYPSTGFGPAPTDADLLRAFPDQPELLDVPRQAGLDELLPPLIARAIELGHLPPGTDPDTVLLGVATIFFGAGVLRRQIPGLPAPVAYGAQLRRLWAALRAEAPPGPSED